MKAELEKLVELQKTDTNIRRLKKAVETAEERRAAIEQEFEQHASSIREIQFRHELAQNERAKLEGEIAKNKEYLERAERNLKHAQNQKEYETAMRETDSLQKQIGTLETQVLEQMTAIEEVENILAERADEINSYESKREAALSEFESQLAKDKAELAELSERRGGVFDTLPKNLANVYDRLVQRSRDGIAVAEVVNGSCSACYIALRPHVQMEVRRGDQIITCENCTRILYVQREDSQNEASA